MKLPSLLRLPKYKRFNYQPRYYDPVKEEIRRKEEIYGSLGDAGGRFRVRESIADAYKRRTRIERKGNTRQGIFILMFTIVAFGYLYVGSYALYALILLVPFYIWIRMRKM